MEESHTPPDICERTFEFAISGHRALAPTATVKESLTTQIQRRRAGNLCARLKNILASNELQENSVVRKFRITAAEGKSYDTQHYNLDAIISVGVEWRLSYRYAVPSHSPGLAHRAYPGTTRPAIIHTATRFYPIAQGCASRYPGNMSQRFINPDGVVSSSGIDAPRRTQPRWGIMSHHTPTQGSRFAATLRYDTESRWDMRIGGDS